MAASGGHASACIPSWCAACFKSTRLPSIRSCGQAFLASCCNFTDAIDLPLALRYQEEDLAQPATLGLAGNWVRTGWDLACVGHLSNGDDGGPAIRSNACRYVRCSQVVAEDIGSAFAGAARSALLGCGMFAMRLQLDRCSRLPQALSYCCKYISACASSVQVNSARICAHSEH